MACFVPGRLAWIVETVAFAAVNCLVFFVLLVLIEKFRIVYRRLGFWVVRVVPAGELG